METSTTLANGALALKVVDGAWQLTMTPASLNYTARLGQPIHYPERTVRADQDWASMPVSGISADDAEAYAAWLRASGRVPGARLCTEVEWERAARGIDGRIFPNGDWLADANIDVTYGRREGAYGPDQVGIHPASDSPFGVHDLAGNVWELVRGADGGAWTRGGCFYVDAKTAHLANRNFVPHDLRHILIGLRMCADAPAAP